MYEDSEERCAPFDKYLYYFETFYIPVIIAVGLIGNSLSCLVFLATFLKMRSSSYYLAALAVADIVYLSALFVVYCSYAEVLLIYNRNGWCQLFQYLAMVSSTLSNWFIVAFTIERFIAIQYPLRRPQICTVSRAKLVIVVLTITAMVIYCYMFWVTGIQGPDICEMVEEYRNFTTIANYIDCVIALIIPFILIVVMNAMIGRNIFMFRKRIQQGCMDGCLTNMEQFSEQKDTSQSSSKQQASSSNSQRSELNKIISQGIQPNIHVKPSSSLMSAKTQRSISKMLLLVSSVFIILNLPSYGIRAYVFLEHNVWDQEPSDMYLLREIWDEKPRGAIWCTQQFAMMLTYTNYSINFLLYAMYGITFRKCLVQLWRNNFNRIRRMNCLRIK